MSRLTDKLNRYDEYISNSRFAGRPQAMVDKDEEIGHMAREARWRAAAMSRARDIYPTESRDRYPASDTSVSSRSRYPDITSANLIYGSNQSTTRPSSSMVSTEANHRHGGLRSLRRTSNSRTLNSGYNGAQYVTNPVSSNATRNGSSATSKYGYIPIGYEPSASPIRIEETPNPIPDRFNSDGSESDRSNHSSWESYRGAYTLHGSDVRFPQPIVRQYPRQTDRDRSQSIQSQRATSGRMSQTGLLPLRTSTTNGPDSYLSQSQRESQASLRPPVRSTSARVSNPPQGLYTTSQRDLLRTSVSTSRAPMARSNSRSISPLTRSQTTTRKSSPVSPIDSSDRYTFGASTQSRATASSRTSNNQSSFSARRLSDRSQTPSPPKIWSTIRDPKDLRWEHY